MQIFRRFLLALCVPIIFYGYVFLQLAGGLVAESHGDSDGGILLFAVCALAVYVSALFFLGKVSIRAAVINAFIGVAPIVFVIASLLISRDDLLMIRDVNCGHNPNRTADPFLCDIITCRSGGENDEEFMHLMGYQMEDGRWFNTRTNHWFDEDVQYPEFVDTFNCEYTRTVLTTAELPREQRHTLYNLYDPFGRLTSLFDSIVRLGK